MSELNPTMASSNIASTVRADEGRRAVGQNFKSFQELKSSVHRDLLNKVDLQKVVTVLDGRIRNQVFDVIQDLVANINTPPMSTSERERLSREVLDGAAAERSSTVSRFAMTRVIILRVMPV